MKDEKKSFFGKRSLIDHANDKTEKATRIAHQSRRVASTYQHIEDALLRALRWFSAVIDKTLFNQKYTKVISLILAVLLYALVNHNENAANYTTTLKSTKPVINVPVMARYNADTFELTGLPEYANVNLVGDASSVTSAANAKGNVIANLEGLIEGTHEVKLTTEGFGDNVTTSVDPSTAIIVLKKKTTQQFDLSYDYINEDKLDAIYAVGEPHFEYDKVNVRASKDTLNSIAFVKALIDVGGQTKDFEQEAQLIAYNKEGLPVKADIVPRTIKVQVPITSPNKSVPIYIEVTGEIPDGKAILSITLDQQAVTVYGSESELSDIYRAVVTLNASTITKDSIVLRPINLPAGISSSNINQVTLDVKLGEGASKVIKNCKINFKNNVNNYKANQPDNKTTTDVEVFGTEENIADITADDIYVYVDMEEATPGLQDFPLQIDQPEGGLVRLKPADSTYKLNVLGEKTEDEGADKDGKETHNG